MRVITKDFGFGDSGDYMLVAQFPFQLKAPPFGYRIAIPYLASFMSQNLHMGLERTFEVLQIVMYSLVLTVWYLWVTIGLRLSSFVSVLTCLLFIFSYPGVYNLHNVVHVGFGEHLFLLLGFIAIYHNRFILLCIIVAVSCFVKENVGALLIPTSLVSNFIEEKLSITVGKVAILSSIFLGGSLLLRSGLLFMGEGSAVQYIQGYISWDYIKWCYNFSGGWPTILLSVLGTFGVSWLLAVAGFWVAPNRLRWLIILPLLAIMQLILAASGAGRMAGLGFPVVLALSGVALDSMHRILAVLLVIINAAFFLCLNHQLHNRPIELGLLGITALILYLAYLSYGINGPEKKRL
jgi:hypothetical protein